MQFMAFRFLFGVAAALLVLAGPAAAAVERYVDDKGTIHITNLGAPPAAEPAVTVPVPPGKRSPGPGSPGSASPAPPEPAPQEGEPPEEPPPARPQTGTGSRPGWSENALASPPADQPRGGFPASPPSAPGARSPGLPVTTFRDGQGTIHITTAPAKMQEDLLRLAGYEWPAHLPRTSVTPAEETALTQVADCQPVPPTLARRAAVAAAVASPGSLGSRTVRRFKDNRGVLHIVSRRTPPSLPPAGDPLPLGRAALPAVSPRPSLPTAPPRVLRDSFGARVAVRREKSGRLTIVSEPALPALARGPSPTPENLRPLTVEAARANDLPVSLVEAVIRVESNFTPHAVSPKGAMGLMQLMPGTARDLGVADPFCPRQNIHGGSRYLRLLLNFFGQDLPLALAAYNAGFRRVLEHGGRIPPIPETQDFVRRVLEEYTLRENGLARFRDGPG